MDFLTTQTGYEFVYRKGVLNTGENGRAGFGCFAQIQGIRL